MSVNSLTSIIISWDLPIDDGGCNILGYRLYRNSGINDEIKINIDDNLKNQPSTFSYIVSSLTNSLIYGF